MIPLPIDSLLADIRRRLANPGALVIQAPPGAGKTTRVPLALLDEPWLQDRKLLMLEPRRLAARMAARHMAAELGEMPGARVGYRVRMETRVSGATRIEIVTEGVLTRLLQDDPALTRYAAVIFDEFHERSLQADLALALCLESRSALRPDLRIIVMSATLEALPVAELLGGAPVLKSEGRMFPVETRHLPPAPQANLVAHAQYAVEKALQEETGNLLVFLPGTGEIHRLEERLRGRLPLGVRLAPLYGDLDNASQDRAVAPPPPGERKVVLATSIAETSLTIEGIRVVVDAGRMRVPRFDPVSGMTRLETVRVSRSSAEQRRGRAGRLEPGICYRLWKTSDDERLAPANTPEILAADLAELVLELARWGARDPGALAWLDPPPTAAWNQARELLRGLGAIDAAGGITAHGRELAALPLHPRLAHMVIRGRALGWGALACDLAALLSEKDPLRTGAPAGADLHLRLALLAAHDAESKRRTGRLRAVAADLRRAAAIDARDAELGDEGVLTAFAYPDRIAQRRPGDVPRYLLANGRGALLQEGDPLGGSLWLAVAQLDGAAREAKVFLAARLEQRGIETHFVELLQERERVEWDQKTQAVLARKRLELGSLILEDAPAERATPEAVAAALFQGIQQAGLDCLPWTDGLRQWQARVLFLRRILGDAWPDVSDRVLLGNLGTWLAPYLAGMNRLSHLARLPLGQALAALLDHRQQRDLEVQAPSHVAVPSGSQLRLDYASGETPILKVRLQEVFGLADTPRLAGGRVPVMLHLLSPAQRPLQTTQDLKGFWQRTWPEVKKEMKGRYPKHHWPDDPLQAPATRAGRKPRPERPKR